MNTCLWFMDVMHEIISVNIYNPNRNFKYSLLILYTILKTRITFSVCNFWRGRVISMILWLYVKIGSDLGGSCVSSTLQASYHCLSEEPLWHMQNIDISGMVYILYSLPTNGYSKCVCCERTNNWTHSIFDDTFYVFHYYWSDWAKNGWKWCVMTSLAGTASFCDPKRVFTYLKTIAVPNSGSFR